MKGFTQAAQSLKAKMTTLTGGRVCQSDEKWLEHPTEYPTYAHNISQALWNIADRFEEASKKNYFLAQAFLGKSYFAFSKWFDYLESGTGTPKIIDDKTYEIGLAFKEFLLVFLSNIPAQRMLGQMGTSRMTEIHRLLSERLNAHLKKASTPPPLAPPRLVDAVVKEESKIEEPFISISEAYFLEIERKSVIKIEKKPNRSSNPIKSRDISHQHVHVIPEKVRMSVRNTVLPDFFVHDNFFIGHPREGGDPHPASHWGVLEDGFPPSRERQSNFCRVQKPDLKKGYLLPKHEDIQCPQEERKNSQIVRIELTALNYHFSPSVQKLRPSAPRLQYPRKKAVHQDIQMAVIRDAISREENHEQALNLKALHSECFETLRPEDYPPLKKVAIQSKYDTARPKFNQGTCVFFSPIVQQSHSVRLTTKCELKYFGSHRMDGLFGLYLKARAKSYWFRDLISQWAALIFGVFGYRTEASLRIEYINSLHKLFLQHQEHHETSALSQWIDKGLNSFKPRAQTGSAYTKSLHALLCHFKKELNLDRDLSLTHHRGM